MTPSFPISQGCITAAGSAFRALVDKSAILGILFYPKVGPSPPFPFPPPLLPENAGKEVLPEVAFGL